MKKIVNIWNLHVLCTFAEIVLMTYIEHLQRFYYVTEGSSKN